MFRPVARPTLCSRGVYSDCICWHRQPLRLSSLLNIWSKQTRARKFVSITAKYFSKNVLTNNSDESNCWSHLAFDVLCVQFRRYVMQKKPEGVGATKSRSVLIPRFAFKRMSLPGITSLTPYCIWQPLWQLVCVCGGFSHLNTDGRGLSHNTAPQTQPPNRASSSCVGRRPLRR